jgi:hypothetical protein
MDGSRPTNGIVKPTFCDARRPVGGAIVDDILDKLQEELARYHDMAKRMRESGDGSPGMLGYLQGAIVASQRAVDIIEGSASTLPYYFGED